MERIRFHRWEFECDAEATRIAYQGVAEGAESCSESVCQNFAAARSHAYPPEVLALFGELGIDHRKEAETFHWFRVGPKILQAWEDERMRVSDDVLGMHFHGGWFHFIGFIAEGPDSFERLPGPPKPGARFRGSIALDKKSHRLIPGASEHWIVRLEPVFDRFSIGFTSRAALVPKSFQGRPIVQVEFETLVPWVLPEPDPRELDE